MSNQKSSKKRMWVCSDNYVRLILFCALLLVPIYFTSISADNERQSSLSMGLIVENASDIILEDVKAGELLYHSAMNSIESIEGWRMEGPGEVWFEDGWMHMKSPDMEDHHVFWSPNRFPESFIAQWQAQNLNTDGGLCIVFFSAAGLEGQSVFSEDLSPRNGSFRQYHSGDIRCYHISYYANTPMDPDRGQANLRKNPGFYLVQEGEEGIPTESEAIHTVTLVKKGAHIRMWIDEHKIIDWIDTGEVADEPHGDGYIALRQMRWSHFRYRHFKVWEVVSGSYE
jgi:hypothetical protein